MNFIYWNAIIDIGFWTTLAKKKIEEYKLETKPRPLVGKYRLSNKPEKLSIFSLDAYSFYQESNEEKSGPVDFKIHGQFLNTNTIEEFNHFNIENKQAELLTNQIKTIDKIIKGQYVKHIMEFYLLIFSDLKKHNFSYQFLSTAVPVKNYAILSWEPAVTFFKEPESIGNLNSAIRFFTNKGEQVPQFFVLKDEKLSNLQEFIKNPKQGSYVFGVADTTNFGKATGYHTSTILAIFANLLQNKLIQGDELKEVKLLLLKQFLIFNFQKEYSFKNSQIIVVDLSKVEIAENEYKLSHKKKLQELDLKSFMDERTLAREAVDLNIKLMKWRLLPSLNIPKIQQAKCLLFGAGTLGCQLSRNLIGWGIKNITFVDYSKVSYSNPVRQTLYEYQDTIKGGKPKAETAAQKLKKIYPQINAQGYSISIPMPGHYVTKEEHIKETFQNLDLIQKLVSEHDAIFLLLDSREARWLPTVLANKYNKACITVGLGFDSFVIVRHGVPPQLFSEEKHKERLCCYFCNDIVTPQNTMKDRTLDQMCTVTKPGLSFVSAAYAAEMYVSLLHHPLEHHAPAHEDPQKLQVTDLGKLAHHLRGNMSDYETNMFYGKAFQQCVACSKFILDEYVNNREEFMLKVLNDPSFIHQVVNLKDELEEFEKMQDGIIEINDDDDIFTCQIDTHEQNSQNSETAEKKL